MKAGGPPPAITKEYQPTKTGDLPGKVDLRNHMSPVEDQSQCNSCCANAVAGAFEYLNMRHCKENGDTPADISRLFIYYVGRKRDQETFFEKGPLCDEGITIGGAITAMQTHGACMESEWPYDLKGVNKKPTEECFEKARRHKVLEASRIPVDLDSMRRCLAEGHPIVFGLKLTQRFFRPRQGFCATPDPSDPQSADHGLHAMLLVGYNDRQSIFVVRNSWGPDWGDQGYGYVPYDYVANPQFNMGEQYAIKGLTEVDFTPDDDDGGDLELPGEDELDGADDIQQFDAEEDEAGDEDELLTDTMKMAETCFWDKDTGDLKAVDQATFVAAALLASRGDFGFAMPFVKEKMEKKFSETGTKEYTFDDLKEYWKEYYG